jgi:LAO/AO transport system kinase
VTPAADIADRVLAGDKSALSRLVSWAENGDVRFKAAMSRLYARVGRAWRIGITGPPGAGKSTLVNELARGLREKKRTVGILAVDPSSPFSGGALLGDRIRMEERTLDPGVYIRSMATRGSHGGLARAAVDACDVMDAFGFDDVLLETVGVGQAEHDIVAATDTVLVVLCPGAGDGIQAMKAGILEIADVLVVNKSDLTGADRLVDDLEEAVHIRQTNRVGRAACKQDGPLLEFADGRVEWTPPVVACSAAKSENVSAVADAIERHRDYLKGDRLVRARAKKRLEHVRAVVAERLDEKLWAAGGLAERARALLDSGRAPYDVVESLVAAIAAPAESSAPAHGPSSAAADAADSKTSGGGGARASKAAPSDKKREAKSK